MAGQCHLTSPAFAALEFVFINVKYCKDSKKHRASLFHRFHEHIQFKQLDSYCISPHSFSE